MITKYNIPAQCHSRPPGDTPILPKIHARVITDTHSVSAAIDGDSRLTSLPHPDWNVPLRVGEPHVDHCKENTDILVNMLEQNRDKDNNNCKALMDR